ncbi:MAG: zinc ribbon domain-containing protein [Dissulfurispiraceae bacterium]
MVVSESYTSQTCCKCGTRGKANRAHRGLYVCKSCGTTIHADVNGAVNILKKHLPEISIPWSSGC